MTSLQRVAAALQGLRKLRFHVVEEPQVVLAHVALVVTAEEVQQFHRAPPLPRWQGHALNREQSEGLSTHWLFVQTVAHLLNEQAQQHAALLPWRAR